MSKRKAEQPHPDGEAAPERSIRLHSAAAAAADEQQQQQPTAAFAAGAPFRRLATVELQLIMQHCDLSTLLALARCSRFTLSAASHPFAWRALSPLSIPTSQIADLRGSRLLAHCDVALRWMHWLRPPTINRVKTFFDGAELAAIESVSRLVELDARARYVGSSELRRLLSHPALTGLTALHTGWDQLDSACTALLPLHQPRLRTLSLEVDHDPDASRRLLAPLPQLPALTDLSLSGSGIDKSAVEILNRCALLRRLHLNRVEPAVLFAVLAAPARARLESLSLSDVVAGAGPPLAAAAGAAVSATDVQSWQASFENLQSLRSLSLQHCKGLNVVFAGAAAALATGTALRNLTALRADTLKMDDEGGSLIPLLAAHCPQLRRLHVYEIYSSSTYSPGTLAGLPLLIGLSDLRLQCDTQPSNDDELAVGRCASLTRLHLTAINSNSLHSILLSPQLQQLESLTLQSVHFDRHDFSDGPGGPLILDWSVCFANLRSLRAFDLEVNRGGDRLLAGLRAACPPLLRSMRFSHDSCFWKTGVVPELRLLARLPALRVELFEEAPRLGMTFGESAHVQSDWCYAWGKLKRKHPERVTITQLEEGNFDCDPFASWSD